MNQKIINNALSAYLGLGILLLLPSKNTNIQDSFVKSHAKTATFFHILFALNYVIFIRFGLFGSIQIPYIQKSLGVICAIVIFLLLFGFLLYGMFQAKSGKLFGKSDISEITKSSDFFAKKEISLNEEGKLTFILSYIPFLGFMVYGKMFPYNNPILQSNVKISFWGSICLLLLSISGHANLALFLILLSIIGIVFLSIYILIYDKIFFIQNEKIPSVRDIYLHFVTLFTYLRNYFSQGKFISYTKLFHSQKSNLEQYEATQNNFLSQKRNNKVPFWFYYIPFLNIIGILDIGSKYSQHVKNGLSLTLLSIILFFSGFWHLQAFILYFMFYGWGEKNNLSYKFYFLSHLLESIGNVGKKIFFFGKKTHTLHKTTTQHNYDIQ